MNGTTLVKRSKVTVLALVCLLGALSGCSSGAWDKSDSGAVPASPGDAGSVVVRVSGQEGTVYTGDYGAIDAEPQVVEETLGAEPTEYEVEVGEEAVSGVSAFFDKAQPSEGELKAEIVADGEVIVESRTRAETGTVIVEWVSEAILLEEDAEPVLEDEESVQ